MSYPGGMLGQLAIALDALDGQWQIKLLQKLVALPFMRSKKRHENADQSKELVNITKMHSLRLELDRNPTVSFNLTPI